MVGAVPFVLAAVALAPSHIDASAASGVDQCNGADGAGSVVRCDVTIANRLDGAATSSSVTVARYCAGTNVNCVATNGTTTSSTGLVTAVHQCNGSGNGGGSTMTCHVRITNTIIGGSPGAPTGATVNQCVGSGTGGGTQPTLSCSPFPASTTGATVTQCNGSANGGGAARRVACSVAADARTSSALPVTVDQCNGSDNGGGSLVTCDVAITTNILVAGGGSTTGGGTTTSGGTTFGGDTTGGSQPPVGGPPPAGGAPLQTSAFPWSLLLLASAGGIAAMAAGVRARARRRAGPPAGR
jgi:hypothetical protein